MFVHLHLAWILSLSPCRSFFCCLRSEIFSVRMRSQRTGFAVCVCTVCVCVWVCVCVDSVRRGWYRCSRSVLVARRAILFPWLAVWLAGWVSYFWMTHTHTHQTLCPLYHTLWDIIYDGSVTYGLFITQWQQSLSTQCYSILSLSLLFLICFPSSLCLFSIWVFLFPIFIFISFSFCVTGPGHNLFSVFSVSHYNQNFKRSGDKRLNA